MVSEPRRRLRREDIDAKAIEVILHFDPHAFARWTSPIYEIVNGLKEKYRIPFSFDQDLGYTANGNKILGRYDFNPRHIHIDKVLPHDSPRFRWTLCHEIGHFVLHRKCNPREVSRDPLKLSDTRVELRFFRTAQWSDLKWVEWQANQFASALLLPEPSVQKAVVEIQRKLNIPRPGSIFLDEQSCNMRAYFSVLEHVSRRMNVSRTVLRIRLLNLGILKDDRRTSRNHVGNALAAFFHEDNSGASDAPEDFTADGIPL